MGGLELPGIGGETLLTLLEAAAVLVSAVAGMLVAAEKRMDIVGAYALACVNAFGGGTVRDLLLDNRPFYWIQHWWFLVTILVLCVPMVYNERMFRLATEVHRRAAKVDAIGLALFTITGVGIALAQEQPLLVAALMGVVAGTTGGVIRDVVVNEMPDVFRPGGLYATASFTGGLAFIAALQNDVPYAHAAALGVAVVLALRLASLHLGVAVPAPHWIDTKEGPRP